MKCNDSIVIFAFRYCLGRMSTAPGSMADYLKGVWKQLAPSTRELIVREINEEMERGKNIPVGVTHPLGMKCDIYTWVEVLEYKP